VGRRVTRKCGDLRFSQQWLWRLYLLKYNAVYFSALYIPEDIMLVMFKLFKTIFTDRMVNNFA
jgi:hypothetical protein